MAAHQIEEPSAKPSARERQLLASVLGRALMDLSSQEEEERRSALEWINDLSHDKPFSFRWIMRHLDLDAAILRVCQMARREYQETIEYYGKEFTRERRDWRERVFKLS